MRIVGNNPQLSRQTQGTASGAITGGKPVLVNTDGTVSQISAQSNATGTPVVFEADSVGHLHLSSAFDSNSNRVVHAYSDHENSNYGTAIVGSVNPSDNSISYGTAVVFNSGTGSYTAATFDSSNNKVLIAFRHQDGDGAGIVGTVDPSDNSISFGSQTKFSGGSFVAYTTATFDSSNNKTVIAYQRPNTNYGTAVVATISGTSVSFGTPVVFESADTHNLESTFDTSNNKVVLAYRDEDNSHYGTAIVGTVSGTGISFGTAVVFSSVTTTGTSCSFDSNSNKVFISFDEHSGNTIKGIVGTVSGTGISFGTAVQIEPALATSNLTSSAFDSNTNKVVVVYGDSGDSNIGKATVGTISGTSVSFETAFTVESGTSTELSANGTVFDSNSNRVVSAYRDGANSGHGTAVVIQTSSTNLSASTSESFIGFAQDTVATGQPVTINTKGAIDENQSSLTPAQQYFVQTDGTLGTSADDPSVVAGTAVTATKLIVKG